MGESEGGLGGFVAGFGMGGSRWDLGGGPGGIWGGVQMGFGGGSRWDLGFLRGSGGVQVEFGVSMGVWGGGVKMGFGVSMVVWEVKWDLGGVQVRFGISMGVWKGQGGILGGGVQGDLRPLSGLGGVEVGFRGGGGGSGGVWGF